MNPHRDDYARAFAERHGGHDAIAGIIIIALLILAIIQGFFAIIGWPASERVFPCDPGQIYAEPGRVYECTPQGAWRLRGAR